MDINGWLTIITVFTAIFALIPKAELVLFFYRIKPFEKWSVLFIVVVLIPYLIFFPNIVSRLEFLNLFTFKWGVKPSTIAFALFYFSFIWFIARLFLIRQNEKITKKHIDYFIELLNEQPFEEFFKLFTKYTSKDEICNDWELYKGIIFRPKFLENVVVNHPSFLLQFWEKFSNENDFRTIFRLFLNNENSAYYKEVKVHWNSYSLLDDKPFLNVVLRDKDNLEQSIDNGLLLVYADYVSDHLIGQFGSSNIYNQPYFQKRIFEDEGVDLPLYCHILFIGLLYSSAIKNNVDISNISSKYVNMSGIYSDIIEGMVSNIDKTQLKENVDSTNYHWLIAQIFSLTENWLTTFNKKEYFSENSSYISFIPFSFSRCMDELYKGFNLGKISQDFLNARIYHNMLKIYFSNQINDEMRSSIEDKVITGIPEGHRQPVLEFVLDEKFGMQYDDFLKENYFIAHGDDLKHLKRFRSFLYKNGMLG